MLEHTLRCSVCVRMPLVAPFPLHRTHILRLLLKFHILRRTPTLSSSVLALSGFRARALLSDTSCLSECPFQSALDNLHFSVLALSGFHARALLSDTSCLSECPFHSALDNLHFMLQIIYLRCFHIQIPQV